MATTTTIYVKQNEQILINIRGKVPMPPTFNDSSHEAVQHAWDTGAQMRALNGRRHYVSKATISGDTRICFVCGTFFRFLANANHSETGERLDGYSS